MQSSSVTNNKIVKSKYLLYLWLAGIFVLFYILNPFHETTFREDSLDHLYPNTRESNLQSTRKSSRIVDNDRNTDVGISSIKEPTNDPNKTAVLVISCNRAKAVENHLKQLIEYRKNSTFKFPIIVSQDCGDSETAESIKSFSSDLFASLQQLNHSDIKVNSTGEKIPDNLQGYYKISRHYKWALDQVFMNQEHHFEFVVVTEDDLNISRDFFDYFHTMSRVLSIDSSLYCVSAWNDNGKSSSIDISRPDLVHRTDVFPGLGWMISRSIWFELREKWPEAFWDDWIRHSDQRKNRVCLRPEISRTQISEYGKKGVSHGEFFERFLSKIVLNEEFVNWSDYNIFQLTKKSYNALFRRQVFLLSIRMNLEEYKNKTNLKITSIKIPYSSEEDFVKIADYFGIMSDFKFGMPRTAYNGVVRVFSNNHNVYLVPN